MSGHTYKIIELVGSSKTSLQDAIEGAVSRSSESVRNSRWFEVTQIRGEIEDGAIAHWQVSLKLGFTIENKSA